MVLAHHLKPLQLNPGVEATVLIAVTFALCLGAYELIRRCAPLRPLFGLRTQAAAPMAGPLTKPASD